jgi:hypothetical protein
MQTLKQFVEANKPKSIDVSFENYISCFTKILYITQLNGGSDLKITHPDYPNQFFLLNKSGYYPEVCWNARSLAGDGRFIVYQLSWQLAIGSKIIMFSSSENIDERTRFINYVYQILNESFGSKSIKLPSKGVNIPQGLVDIIGYRFAFASEICDSIVEIQSRYIGIQAFMQAINI